MKIFNMPTIAITIDIDWASEVVIELTLDYFIKRNIPITVFSTHDSMVLRDRFKELKIGLHPYFSTDSDHGTTIDATIEHIQKLPHNIKAYRCHRYIVSNEIQEKMQTIGMECTSNVCTNLENIQPFYNRFNTLEAPIFLEDGGYLFNNHPLELNMNIKSKMLTEGLKTISIHPMHFALNTPNWEFMRQIKKRSSRKEWNNFNVNKVNEMRYGGTGITDFMESLVMFSVNQGSSFISLENILP